MDKFKIITLCVISALFTLTLVSCASTPPKVLQLEKNDKSISIDYPEMKSSLGKTVRWGGVILDITNNLNNTQITILGYPLDSQARPITYRQNKGTRRFIANFNRFIEPNNYSVKREITIIGTLDRIEQGKVGDYDYEFPVITVNRHLLWVDRNLEDDPYNNNGYYSGNGYYPYYYPYFGPYWGHGRHHFYRGYYY